MPGHLANQLRIDTGPKLVSDKRVPQIVGRVARHNARFGLNLVKTTFHITTERTASQLLAGCAPWPLTRLNKPPRCPDSKGRSALSQPVAW